MRLFDRIEHMLRISRHGQRLRLWIMAVAQRWVVPPHLLQQLDDLGRFLLREDGEFERELLPVACPAPIEWSG